MNRGIQNVERRKEGLVTPLTSDLKDTNSSIKKYKILSLLILIFRIFYLYLVK